MIKKILAALALLALIGGGLAVWKGSGVAHAANGYAAKWVCSSVHVTGRSAEQAMAEMPPNPLARWLVLEDTERGATVSMAGMAPRRAEFRGDDLGCTLVPPGRGADALAPVEVGDWRPAESAAPGPAAGSETPADAAQADLEKLAGALDRAFSDPNPEKPRRTRAVVVLHRGERIAERYAEGFSAETPLTGWSMTKSVMNALIGRAVALGRIEPIDRPAPVPEWSGAEDARGAITTDHLLRMSSGLSFEENYANLFSDAMRMLFVEGDAAAVAAASRPDGPPDSSWSYSSGTSNLLSRLLRDQLGAEAYGRFPREQLFAPLGMRSARLEADASGVFVASSFGWATARDWARFGQLYLQDGVWEGQRLLPEGWVDYSRRPTPEAPRGIYGAQFWLNAGEPGDPDSRRWPQMPADAYWASGHAGQFVVIVPSRRCVIVRLGLNHHRGEWSLGDFVADVLDALPAA
ncbi:MAG: serine hydrolase [Acidobacteriota bacterium]